MFLHIILLLLISHVSVVLMFLVSQAGVPEKLWRENCYKSNLALNDCNWCKCGKNLEYVCTARVCSNVDMFGHFNDAILDLDVGMEGHGVWRSKTTVCEAGVHYKKREVLCVCTEEGLWPNPVCRDIFQVLYAVEPSEIDKVNNQTCLATKLYQVGCNVCYCPSSGYLDPDHCTKKNCSADIVKKPESMDSEVFDEIYANCERAKKYKLGCKTCVCLPNNRLLCDNCTSVDNITAKGQMRAVDKKPSLCSGKNPKERFNIDCNTCFCDRNYVIYCTALRCLKSDLKITLPAIEYDAVEAPIDDAACIENTTYKKDNNTCYCYTIDNVKHFKCSVKHNRNKSKTEEFGCVEGKVYEKNCLICQCFLENYELMEECIVNKDCESEKNAIEPSFPDIRDMHGYCEPLHEYRHNCNKCKCLSNGKTVACTSKICGDSEPVVAEFIPFIQKNNACPPGHQYKVDCNLCLCMSNGNALCTVKPCNKQIIEDYFVAFLCDPKVFTFQKILVLAIRN